MPDNSVEMGYESALYINSGTYAVPVWNEIDLARSVEPQESVDKQDVTTRRTARSGKKAYAYGLGEDGFNVEMLVPAAGETNAAYSALEAAKKARTPVDILHVEGGIISTDGLPAHRVICGVFGGNKSEPNDGSASARSYELNFMLNSDQAVPEEGVTSGGAFVAAS